MITFIKGKFNFLAAFCIVAIIFIIVAIMTAHYMYKKIKKFNTSILSHRTDFSLLMIMNLFTAFLTLILFFAMPEGPKGMPSPAFKDL
jgi:hypothetical protein